MGTCRNIVIIPGWMHGRDAWAAAQNYLPDYEVTVLELPGFGSTPLVSDDWGVPEYAKWVQQQLNTYTEPFVLVGHSLGGRIASYLAGTGALPVQCAGIVLYAAPALYRPSVGTRTKSALAHFLRVTGLARLVPQSFKPVDTQQADSAALGKIFRTIVPFDQTSYLPHITVPTALLWGAQDTSVPLAIAYEMQKLIPHSTLHVIDDAGHNAHLQNLSLFYATLENILKNY